MRGRAICVVLEMARRISGEVFEPTPPWRGGIVGSHAHASKVVLLGLTQRESVETGSPWPFQLPLRLFSGGLLEKNADF